MSRIFKAGFHALIAMLIMIQHDEFNQLLIHEYKSLTLVCVLSMFATTYNIGVWVHETILEYKENTSC